MKMKKHNLYKGEIVSVVEKEGTPPQIVILTRGGELISGILEILAIGRVSREARLQELEKNLKMDGGNNE